MRLVSYSKKICSMVKPQFEKDVKVIWSNNREEFISTAFKFYAKKSIVYQTSLPWTPQQNGRVRREHGNILNVARALIFQGDLPKCF